MTTTHGGSRVSRTVLELSFQLGSSPTHPPDVNTAIRALRDVLPADSVGRFDVDLTTGRSLLASDPPEHSSPHIAEMLLKHAPDHPTMRSLLRHPRDQSPRRVSDLLPILDWQQTLVYHDVFAPMGVQYNVSFLTRPMSSGTLAGWSFSRSKQDFADHDMELAASIQLVMASLDRLHSLKPLQGNPEATEQARTRAGLTIPELEVLQLLARGMTASQIGRVRRISARTVGKHLQHAYHKLGTHDRLLAVDFCRQLGLIPEPRLPEHPDRSLQP